MPLMASPRALPRSAPSPSARSRSRCAHRTCPSSWAKPKSSTISGSRCGRPRVAATPSTTSFSPARPASGRRASPGSWRGNSEPNCTRSPGLVSNGRATWSAC
ncbi:UNVERIFIED_CONTAM: hypothetical protein GTU68_051239 [Idotea baltica]|nr:hypothetical protein [Idotea baltica]